jgi:hypothetical protein
MIMYGLLGSWDMPTCKAKYKERDGYMRQVRR